MDLINNSPNLRRLLAKRQNPCTRAFKLQPSNSTNEPNSAINHPKNSVSSTPEQHTFNINHQNPTPTVTISFPPIITSNETIQTNSSQRVTSMENPITIEDDDESDDCDGSLFEKIEKKPKTTTLTPVQPRQSRTSSFEEDKHSEPSTTYDVHSEFNTTNENGDFLSSPSINHANSRSSDFKVDSIEEIPNSPVLKSNRSTAKTSPVKQVQEAMKNLTENLAACDYQPSSKQKVKCKLNHQYDLDLSSISKKSCSRCSELLEECRAFARSNNGRCVNEEYDQTITYQCHKGHTWNLNYKNARRRWCAQCSKDSRNLLKKKCEEEKFHREKEDEKTQQNLFEEAKKRAIKENAQKAFSFGGPKPEANSNQKPMTTLEYFQRIDYEIETLAKKYSNEFMASKDFKGDVDYNQTLQVYKILIMPEQVLQTYMFNLNAEALRSEFRRMAKIIHPDKNKHPQSGPAFQKVYKVYEVALSRLEGK